MSKQKPTQQEKDKGSNKNILETEDTFDQYNFYKSENNESQELKQLNTIQQSMSKMSIKPQNSSNFATNQRTITSEYRPSNESLMKDVKKDKEKVIKKNDKYGLLGLLNVIKMEDKDLNLLALGYDLTTLGLNLNSPEFNLYTTFASPWNDTPTRIQPEFTLPSCYYLEQPLPLNKHWAKFQDETLFYIFYSMPKDICQVLSYKELYRRKWLYHFQLKIWIQRIQGAEISNKTQTSERSSFFYFDCQTWKKAKKENFVLEYDKIMY